MTSNYDMNMNVAHPRDNQATAASKLPQAVSYPLLPKISIENAAALINSINSIDDRLSIGPEIAKALKIAGDPKEYAECVLALDDQLSLPAQWVTISVALRDALVKSTHGVLGASNFNAAFRTIFEQRPEHLTTFSPFSLNLYNQLYYAIPESHSSTPSFFNRLALARKAIGALVKQHINSENPRIGELCAGQDWELRWKNTAEQLGTGCNLSVTLSDIHTPSLKNASRILPSNISVAAERNDLLEPPAPLPESSRFDLMIALYAFDSVWLPKDLTLIKRPELPWCEASYRIGLADWHPHSEQVRHAFKTGDISQVTTHDFRQLIVERVLAPSLLAHDPSIAAILSARLGESQEAQFVAPFGMVDYIIMLFERQIKAGGCLIVGDAGINDPAISTVHDFMNTGVGGKFKGLDFPLTASLLTSHGFKVSITPIEELARSAFQPGDEADLAHITATPHTHVMVIKRAEGQK